MTDIFNVNKLERNQKRPKLEDTQICNDDEEQITCLICSEVWSSGGQHCLVSLRCGHLFGKSCINRWILEKTQRSGAKQTGCPTCKATARTVDIRIVLPVRFAVIDSAELDTLKLELESKKMRISDQQRMVADLRMSLCMHKNQLKRAKEEMI